ncbi:MAG: hypothetical protein WD040_05115 [Anaerolineales bacterium]
MIEAGLWCAAALLSAPAARWVTRRWPWLLKAAPLAPWVYGLGPPFAALMRGAVQPREFGLEGFRPQDWLTGALIASAVVAGAALALRTRPTGWERLDPVDAVLDEARWGLYRAAGVAWTAAVLPGATIGLALSLVEAYLRSGTRSRPRIWATSEPLALLRPAGSTLLFILTGNVWLTALAQAGLILALSALSPPGESRDDSRS